MEKKRGKKKANADSVSEKEEKPSSVVTLDEFFVRCVRQGKLKEWQKAEIEAFFKDMKLREKEKLEVYEATLGKY